MYKGFMPSSVVHTVTEFRALRLPMNALCRIAGIGYTITEIRADCLTFGRRKVYGEYHAYVTK